jgi:hypothetical protein
MDSGEIASLAKTPQVSPPPPEGSLREAHEREDQPVGVLVPAVPRITQAVQLIRAIQPASGNPAPASTAHEPASVQISIGRVEVRAMTSPEPPRAPKPAALRLTLDDYLRQRSRRLR